MNQPQIVIIFQSEEDLGEQVWEKKVPGTNPLHKPNAFSQSLQIQRPPLPGHQEQQIPSAQRVIHPTSVERKCIIQPLNNRQRVQPR